MAGLLDEFYTLTEEELNYKRLWEEGKSSVEYLMLPEEVEEYARLNEKIVLRPDYFLPDDGSNIRILKHPVWMPRYLHAHEYIEITYIVSGKVSESIEGEAVTLRSGDLMILSPGIYHNIWADNAGTVALNFIVTKETFITLDAKYSLGHAGNQFTVWHSPLPTDLIERMLQENKKSDSVSMFMLEALFSEMLITVKRSGSPLMQVAFETRKELFEIISYIEENFRTVTLSSFADHYEITEQYASRFLREKLGVPFSVFIKRLRMEEAGRLLQFTTKSAKEISYLVGYSSPEHFSRTFRSYYGKSPEAWRKENRA